MEPVNFIILAAGKGERMRSALPKPLHKIGELTMLEHVLNSLKGIEGEKTVVVVSDKKVAKTAIAVGAAVVWQKEQLGTADAVKVALQECPQYGDILITCADIPRATSEIFIDLYTIHRRKGNYITLLTCSMPDPSGYGRVLTEENNVVRIVEEADATDEERQVDLVNSGIMCMKLEGLRERLDRVERSRVKNEYYLTDIIQIAAADGKKVGHISCDYRYVTGVNTKEQLEEVSGSPE